MDSLVFGTLFPSTFVPSFQAHVPALSRYQPREFMVYHQYGSLSTTSRTSPARGVGQNSLIIHQLAIANHQGRNRENIPELILFDPYIREV